MNGDLIDILELIVILKLRNKNILCAMLAGYKKCDCSCNECLLNTHKAYIHDYPIRIIEVKGKLNE
ncbi:hypothetical protein SP076_00410 [Salmonella phage FSL SP-076]|uniref:Uncharacterized protein n=1 Tax=Salmonella phage FSL SP-076 TaxID=1173762 RepID=S4TRV4_9CAUD|nr:hypothetical protein SP076_00410 [Salmonella phage FSL SP-076]AGF88413.1 hypothetical protein SP076_00410 [Salmonella phage FSL SP-076]